MQPDLELVHIRKGESFAAWKHGYPFRTVRWQLTSVDGAPEAVQAIADGGPFIQTTAQFPRDQVRVGLGMALAQYWGARVVPTEVPIDVRTVDAENAADFSW